MASEETPTTYLKDYKAYPYDVQHVRPPRSSLSLFSRDLTTTRFSAGGSDARPARANAA